MKKILMVMAAVLFLTVTVLAEENPEKVQFRLRLKVGESYRFRDVYSETMTQNMPEQPEAETLESKMEIVYVFKVMEIGAKGAALIEVSFESLNFKHDGPDGALEFKSSDPPEHISFLLMPYAMLTTDNFMAQVFPNGKLKIIRGYQDSIAELSKSLVFSAGPDMSKGTRDFVTKYFLDTIGDQALQEMLQDTVMPEKPVGIGDSWLKKNVYTRGVPLISEAVLTLKERNQGIATIEMAASLKSNLNAPPPIEMDNLAMRYEFTGQGKGLIELQESNGWPLRAEISREISGKLRVVKGPKKLKDQSWPFSGKSTEILESIDDPVIGEAVKGQVEI